MSIGEGEFKAYHNGAKEKIEALFPIFAKLCTGDYTARVEIPDEDDEFTQLYIGIDMMLNVINKQFDRLNELNALLEKRVQHKTGELQQQLEFSKALLTAQSDLGEGLFISNGDDRRLIYVNPALCRMTGYSAVELAEMPSFLTLIDPDARAYMNEHLELYKNGQWGPECVETRLVRKDGSQIHAEIVVKPLSAEKEPKRFVALCRDITERKKMEEQKIKLAQEEAARLQAEAQQERAIFLAEAGTLISSSLDYQSTPSTIARLSVLRISDWCAVYLCNEEGRIQHIHVAHANPEKEKRAQTLEKYLPQPDHTTSPVIRAIKTGYPEVKTGLSSADWDAIALDPAHRQLLEELGFTSYMAVPIQFRGRVLGVIFFAAGASNIRFASEDLELAEELALRAGIALDNAHLYTETLKTKGELAQARDAALESVRLKSEFVANVSHELRSPLNAIVGMAGLLMDTKLSPKQRHYLETLRNSSEALLGIINDLLDFSKIEAGKMPLEVQDFDLKAVVDSAVEIISHRAKAKGLQLLWTWPAGMTRQLRGDPARLRQVLTNLLSNAVKFTEEGKVEVRIRKQNEATAHVTFVLEVEDTGVGIPAEKRNDLFQPFSQVDNSTTRKYGGTGLGLAISKHFIELMKGEIDFKSNAGQGSTFWCRLTLEKSASTELPDKNANENKLQSQRLLRTQWQRVRTQRPHILVAEDNSINQKVVLLQLKKLGVKADAVGSGMEVLQALKQVPYDLILMDCQMPMMDGYMATAQIRKKEDGDHHIPIIAMTAHAMAGDRERCLTAGMDDYLPKPVRTEDLAETIIKWTNQKHKSSHRRNSKRLENGADSIFVLPQGLNSPSFIRKLATIFLRQTPAYIKNISEAIRKDDAKELGLTAHTLKGSCANLGLKPMVSLCSEMEVLGKNGAVSGAAEILRKLESEFERIAQVLRESRGGRKS